MRAQHLQDALRSAHGDEVVVHLARLVNLLSRGDAPRTIAPFLGGASLVALHKPQGGLRPIAVGEILRRLVAKYLYERTKDDAKEFL